MQIVPQSLVIIALNSLVETLVMCVCQVNACKLYMKVQYSIDMLPSLKLLGGKSKVNETKFKIRDSELVLGYLSHSLF